MKPSFGFKAVNLGVILALLALSCILPTRSVQAEPEATFAVTKLTDSNGTCTVTNCSLREAIIAANATPSADTITLPAGAYVLSIAGAGENLAATGDLDIIAPVTITGAGRSTTSIDGADFDRVFDIFATAGTVNISGVTIKNGSSTQYGGCIQAANPVFNLTNAALTDCVASEGGGGLRAIQTTATLNRVLINNNTARTGGGMDITDARVTLNNCQLTGNTATNTGGAVYQSNPNSVFNMTSSLVNANTADIEAGGLFLANGSSAVISNSTISGNITDGYGGGLNTRIPTLISHSTIVNNIADNDNNDTNPRGGGLFFYQPLAVAQIHNSLVANNQDKGSADTNDCALMYGPSLTSLGYNLVENPGTTYWVCPFNGPGDITGQDPNLDPLLKNNGGLSFTHALLPGSPAINAGDPAFAPPPAFDQRGTGYPRVEGGRLDIGAFELRMNEVYMPLIRR